MDSQVTFDADGTPIYDRAVTSEPLRNLLKKLMTNGVLPNPSTNMQVTPGEGMSVIVLPGFAHVEGELALEQTSRTLVLQAAVNQPRIDTVVLRLNTNTEVRTCDLYVREGIAGTSPERPELTRNSSIYEIGLADIFVAQNSTTITQARITDTRMETERCGYISAIAEFDTTTLYDQIQADLADFKENNEDAFIAWVESLQDILDEETAGHLQLEIEALQNEIAEVAGLADIVD